MQPTVDHWHLSSGETTARQGRIALVRSALRNILPTGWFDAWAAPLRRADTGAHSRDPSARDRIFTHAIGTTDAAAFRFSLR